MNKALLNAAMGGCTPDPDDIPNEETPDTHPEKLDNFCGTSDKEHKDH